MSNTDVIAETATPKSYEAWRKKAERHGVSTRTLDRWWRAGIISPPVFINGRKYADVNEEPRIDGEAA
jgi:predicted site-specific integrase-resolvase